MFWNISTDLQYAVWMCCVLIWLSLDTFILNVSCTLSVHYQSENVILACFAKGKMSVVDAYLNTLQSMGKDECHRVDLYVNIFQSKWKD